MSRSRLVTTELDGPRDVARWRRIRNRIVAGQRRDRPHPRLPASMLQIDVVDRGPCVHYPASIDDVRNVLDRLPPGTLDGLGRITFRTAPDDDGDGLHPFLSPSTYGTYRPSDASIELFAYIYPSAIPERPILETHLRAQMLCTLLHEVAHHRDFRRRGRLREHEWDDEVRADAIAAGWKRAHLLPYLEEAYPAECAELQRWLLRHTGIELSIELLLGARDGGRYLFNAAEGFDRLLAHVMRGEPIDAEARCDFAFRVHYQLDITEALQLVEHVLASEPDHAEALKWRAHFLDHLKA